MTTQYNMKQHKTTQNYKENHETIADNFSHSTTTWNYLKFWNKITNHSGRIQPEELGWPKMT